MPDLPVNRDLVNALAAATERLVLDAKPTRDGYSVQSDVLARLRLAQDIFWRDVAGNAATVRRAG